MRQTTAYHHDRYDHMLRFYPLRARIVERSDDPESSIGSAYTDAGARTENVRHDNVPARFEVQTGGGGERPTGSLSLGVTNFSIGLLGLYPDIEERDDVIIGDERYNVVAVGVQDLARRTRMRCTRKP